MSNGIDEEDVEELDEDLEEGDFGPDDGDPIGFEDFEDDEEFEELEGGGGGGSSTDVDISEANYEEALKANPKRLSAAQRKKASALIEGIIDGAELSTPEGQTKAWTKLNDQIGVAHARKYDIKAEFTENDVIDHPKFGVGFVVELVHAKKIEVLFQEGLKKLACNVG